MNYSPLARDETVGEIAGVLKVGEEAAVAFGIHFNNGLDLGQSRLVT